ncbi:C4-dicarboxylate ABC transporter permease [Acuticoccus sediminis]|uniref:TRAP transporter small permease protein n=1 Tax=Acuticoccus sediminis TaxID=2184697 RepID=A0A8B2NHN0_9HYPH|nr:TRAP transporter small permease subunit [Acuticoccus sediminis]RAH98991.1 C4-dicarboxylate ABC transporter permease [Acuticoccus sediminis]
MARLLAVAGALDLLVRRVGQVAAWLAVALMLVIVFDVITRHFLVLGSTKLQDLEWHLHAALFLLTLGYAYVEGAHVRIDILHARFGPRTAAWVELLGATLMLAPFCLVVLYYGYAFWERSFMMDEGSASQTGLPHRWVIKAFLLFGFGFLFLAALGAASRSLAILLGAPAGPTHPEHQEVGL